MVLIDTVYQRVLALANKEQRGYITPQEFNLFANQAQLEILDRYVFDINGAARLPGSDKEYSDMSNLLDEKLGVFKTEVVIGANNIAPIASTSAHDIPIDSYILGSVFRGGKTATHECDQISQSEYNKQRMAPLLSPSVMAPICVVSQNRMHVSPASANVLLSYTRSPSNVGWGYVVINNKALYDPAPTKTFNFELHPSEETELVYKILKLSGAAIQRNDVAQFAQGMEQGLQQQEKQ